MARCRHERHSWLIAGLNGEWCYVCGAYRGLTRNAKGELTPRTNWVRPTGDADNNPFGTLRNCAQSVPEEP